MKTTKISGSSRACEEYVNEHLTQIGQVKKIVSYQERANFMLTEYDLLDFQPMLVLENTNGALWYFDGLNCGYGGAGPHATKGVLETFGVLKEDAAALFGFSGFTVTFSGTSYNMRENQCLFSQDDSPFSNCPLTSNCIARPNLRQVHFINPQRNHPAGLFTCLSVMKPYNMTYTFGRDSLSEIPLEVLDPTFRWRENRGLSCNLIVRGKQFSLFCYLNPQELTAVIQAISLFVNQTPLFREHHLHGRPVWTFEKLQENASKGTKWFMSLLKPMPPSCTISLVSPGEKKVRL